MGNVLAVVGTKGGVSKTTVAMGVAIWTAKLKPRERVLLIDGDLHVRSVELKLCPTSEATLADVLSGKRDWRDAVYTCQLASDSALLYPNLAIMPAGGRFFPLHRDVASEFERVRKIFERMIEELRSEFFLVLIDTPASVSYEHFILTAAADRVLYVCEANDDSIDSTLTTACGLRKLLGIEPAGVVLSKLMRGAGSREWIKKASKIGRVLGTVPFDPVVDEAFRENLPVVAAYPESSASRAIRRIAQKLLRFRITERTRFSDRIDRAVEQVSRQMAKTKSLKT
jgi:MinD-like ATPase involved in chromosome partitioning or flagellar assembly